MKYIAYGIDRENANQDLIRRISEIAPEYSVISGQSRNELDAYLGEIEIAFRSPDTELLTEMPSLRWYQAWSAGVDHLIAYDAIRNGDFQITSASGIHPVPMAEHIFSLLLSLSRGLVRNNLYRQERRWVKVDQQSLFELEGKTMLILGAGRIGRRTATVARAFGMRVIAVKRRHLERLGPYDEVVAWEAFREYLGRADVVLNILPLTPDTEGLFGDKEFSQMKSEAVFLNLGRGKTVKQQALIKALEKGEILAAGLDVFDPEPLPDTSPLWRMENVAMTCHYAGFTPHYEERAEEIFLANLRRYLDGETLENLADRSRGY